MLLATTEEPSCTAANDVDNGDEAGFGPSSKCAINAPAFATSTCNAQVLEVAGPAVTVLNDADTDADAAAYACPFACAAAASSTTESPGGDAARQKTQRERLR